MSNAQKIPLRNGFHEDGYSSAVDILENMGVIAG